MRGALGVERVQEPRRDRNAEEVAHRFGRPLEGQVLVAEQVKREGPQPRTVTVEGTDVDRELGLGDHPAHAAPLLGPVFGP